MPPGDRSRVTTESRRRFLELAAGAGAAAAGLSSVRRARASDLPVTGIEQKDLASFDDMMRDFVREQQVPGAALAVTRQGRLVYARGFGVADRAGADREGGQAVEPTDLFRIASLSKPITAVAVLQLVERKKLALDDKVCQVLTLHQTTDARWQEVTIGQLLHHTGGWDRDKSFDPMFRSVKIAKHFDAAPPAMPEQIIRYMTGEPLDFDPGTRYAYSNFGYCLLGRVIEHVGQQKYGEHVRREVLAPLGIQRMRLGATLLAGRQPHEVRYYDRKDRSGPAVMGNVGEKVPLPYGTWCLEAMDAHGGWIASAVDLVRFASAFNKPRHCPILEAGSIERMFARPPGLAGHKPDGSPKDVYYGCGWQVRSAGKGHNTWHTGALDGTSTLLVRRHDDLDWAVLFNGRQNEQGKELAGAIDSLVHRAADAVSHWPEEDQFGKLGVG